MKILREQISWYICKNGEYLDRISYITTLVPKETEAEKITTYKLDNSIPLTTFPFTIKEKKRYYLIWDNICFKIKKSEKDKYSFVRKVSYEDLTYKMTDDWFRSTLKASVYWALVEQFKQEAAEDRKKEIL